MIEQSSIFQVLSINYHFLSPTILGSLIIDHNVQEKCKKSQLQLTPGEVFDNNLTHYWQIRVKLGAKCILWQC